MLPFRAVSVVKTLLLLLFIGSATEFVLTTDAEARAGRGRSAGRGGGFGSRRTPPPAQQQPAPNAPAGQPAGGGSLMRGVAGGLAGGFLGSMLFSSMGQAKNADGSPAGGGGIGLLEIILFGGLAYFGFRWWKNRQATVAFSHASVRHGGGYQTMQRVPTATGLSDLGHIPALAGAASVLTTDEASDLFFKVQAAWTRRDLSPIKSMLGPEIHASLNDDLSALKARQHINRLENVAVRGTEVLDAWQEAGAEYTAVRFSANLLDYTVDERTGQVVEGSDVAPVKFEEDWTFAKVAPAAPWQLVGIAQV